MQSDFIGDVQFDEDEITQMKEDCKKFYRAAQNTWSKYYKREDICELRNRKILKFCSKVCNLSTKSSYLWRLKKRKNRLHQSCRLSPMGVVGN